MLPEVDLVGTPGISSGLLHSREASPPPARNKGASPTLASLILCLNPWSWMPSCRLKGRQLDWTISSVTNSLVSPTFRESCLLRLRTNHSLIRSRMNFRAGTCSWGTSNRFASVSFRAATTFSQAPSWIPAPIKSGSGDLRVGPKMSALVMHEGEVSRSATDVADRDGVGVDVGFAKPVPCGGNRFLDLTDGPELGTLGGIDNAGTQVVAKLHREC